MPLSESKPQCVNWQTAAVSWPQTGPQLALTGVQRRHWCQLALAGAGVGAVALAAQASAQGALVAGRDYLVVPTAMPYRPQAGKVEVLQFFGYWCPHCYSLESRMDVWLSQAPAKVAFNRVPVFFGAETLPYQKTYFTLENLGLVGTLHVKLFEALHKERKTLRTDADLRAWVLAQGVKAAQYDAALQSFTVQTNVRRAQMATDAYKIEGVPAFVVAAKYLVPNSPNVFATINALVQTS